MTVIHDNECIKEKKTTIKGDYLLINQTDGSTETRNSKADEQYTKKCKIAVVFSITCVRVRENNSPLSFSLSFPSVFLFSI